MRINLDTSDIEAFSAIARTLSFTMAAEMLNLSPSALSRRIQKLEAQLDVRLLERTTREVKLTLAGKRFLARSSEIMTNIDEVVRAIKGDGVPKAAYVTIASIPSIVHRILPETIQAFAESHPTTRIRIRDMTTNEVVDAVQRGEADFGITSFVQHDDNLTFTSLTRAEFVALIPADHVFASRKRLRWAELADQRIISTWRGAGVRMIMDFELARANCRLVPFYEVQQIYTALKFAESGLGIAPVPAFFLGRYERSALAMAALIEPVITIDLGTIVSSTRPLTGQACEFHALLQQAWAAPSGGANRIRREASSARR